MSLENEVIIYYGTSGHGCGLVDGMSSFGVKIPLRKEILNHVYWSSAKQIIDILVGMKLGGDNVYKEISKNELQELQKEKKNFELEMY